MRIFDDLKLEECEHEDDTFAPRKGTVTMTIKEIYKNRCGSVVDAEKMKQDLPAKECKGLYYLKGKYVNAAKKEANWNKLKQQHNEDGKVFRVYR